MSTCPFCNSPIEDNATFCTTCGKQISAPAFAGNNQPNAPINNNASYNGYSAPQYTQPVMQSDPYDHTAEFDQKDISDNKVMAMLVYLLGIVGIFLAVIASSSSPYVMFHVRQSLKITVVEVLMSICAVLLCWTFIVPFAYAVMSIVFLVIKIICFFQICSGKANEPAIIRSLNFLK